MELFSDLRLVVGQVKGELEARDLRMQEYLNQVRHSQLGFKSFTLQQIPRSRNTHADSLATLVTSSVQSLPRVILVEICVGLLRWRERRSIFTGLGLNLIGWILLCCFLRMTSYPRRKGEADKVRRKAPRFWLFED